MVVTSTLVISDVGIAYSLLNFNLSAKHVSNIALLSKPREAKNAPSLAQAVFGAVGRQRWLRQLLRAVLMTALIAKQLTLYINVKIR